MYSTAEDASLAPNVKDGESFSCESQKREREQREGFPIAQLFKGAAQISAKTSDGWSTFSSICSEPFTHTHALHFYMTNRFGGNDQNFLHCTNIIGLQ